MYFMLNLVNDSQINLRAESAESSVDIGFQKAVVNIGVNFLEEYRSYKYKKRL